MKAFVLAAGLGTRLKPWTLEHPKALVPVQGVPMLQRIVSRLQTQGFDYITVNIHHFSGQMRKFICSELQTSAIVSISDESDRLLDTGGALLHAAPLLSVKPGAVLIHNVDILSNANLKALMECHNSTNALATLLVSPRVSSRQLAFDSDGILRGWTNQKTGEVKGEIHPPLSQYAFSGIHVISEELLQLMSCQYRDGDKFSIIDFYLNIMHTGRIRCYIDSSLTLIDIGKPDTYLQAQHIPI